MTELRNVFFVYFIQIGNIFWLFFGPFYDTFMDKYGNMQSK